MPSDRDHFEAWYASVLECLYPNRDAGMVIAAVAFPLLERHVRQKIKLSANKRLTDNFFDEIRSLIPGIKDRSQARKFWATYRNGLLHQVTSQLDTGSGGKLPEAVLTHDISAIFAVERGVLELHPVMFARLVVETIRKDFVTFVGKTHIGPPLPVEGQLHIQHMMTVTTLPFSIVGKRGL